MLRFMYPYTVDDNTNATQNVKRKVNNIQKKRKYDLQNNNNNEYSIPKQQIQMQMELQNQSNINKNNNNIIIKLE